MRIEKQEIDEILDMAKSRGADAAEVYAVNSRTISAEAKSGAVDALVSAESSGFSLRVLIEGRPGFGYSTDITDWKRVVDSAIESARWGVADRHILFPYRYDYPRPDIFDVRIEDAGETDAISIAVALEEAALSTDGRIKKVRKAATDLSVYDVYIANTNGLAGGYKSTSCAIQLMAMAEENGESQIGWEYYVSKSMSDISTLDVGRTAAMRALKLLGCRKINTVRTSIILDNSVANEFLSIFVSALSSENVQKGKSLLIGKKDMRIVSERINVIDDALLPYCSGSRPFDGEGVASRRNVLIKEGTLVGYMYNTYTASKDGVTSTGNGSRGSIYTTPGIGIGNLFLEASAPSYMLSLESMISGLSDGLLVTEAMGLHTANPISGDFSIGVNGVWIEKGALAYPVKEAVISGNVLDLFNKIDYICDDSRFYGNTGCPSLLIRSIDISS